MHKIGIDLGGTKTEGILLDEKLDKRNFRKNISKIKVIKKTKEKQEGVAHKPAYLYTYDKL